ncbi:MAG: UDP-phosphate alpha-N-acetylglucosaminyltransferase [Rickettsiaceae bacterium]
MKYIISLVSLSLISVTASAVMIKHLILLLTKYKIVDVPSNRRAHKAITPRGAGLSFILIFILLLPLSEYYLLHSYEYSAALLQIFIPISLVSFYDDVSGVSIPIRLLVHVLCALLAIMWLILPNHITPFAISMSLDLVISALALLTFFNLFNFLDGIDGITASQTIHLASTILILCYLGYDVIINVDMVIIISIIILGWAVGFIYFNWSPAQIFLGDGGSISLGFLLGICLLSVAATNVHFFLACVIASLYYIADGGGTILLRLAKGERIWEPHLQHFFQKSVQKGRNHQTVVKGIIKCNSLLMVFSASSLYYPTVSVICALIVVSITLNKSIR